MASGPLSYADYSVGWISALPLEFTAALAMLDERHPPLPRLLHDDNVYVLGSIRSHNVVMACLPAGQTGTNAAATVASQMRVSYPTIRFWLMVGIGGGAPSAEHDIRLGDVVVSKPGKNDNGVIQYDFGRTIEAGRFVQNGSLNGPPAALLNAVSVVQAVHRAHGHQLHEHLKVFEESEALRHTYTYRGWEKDVNFEANYDHVCGASDCSLCDKSRLVPRVRRRDPASPTIHYGSIASANQVMRHGESRESLRKEMDVLCFEMEAAGLMNNFPCLVIRGICDYADSHKNKDWQDYAAATAAAYAKELLSIIPGSTVPERAAPTGTMNTGQSRSESDDEQELSVLKLVPLSYLPFQRNPRFSGRKPVIASIEAHFARCKTQNAFILRGMGGIGKTQIALEYAYQCLDQGFDVFWVNCTTPQTLFSDFNQILRTVKAIKADDYEEDRLAVLRWLECHKRWLLIFDNADDATFPYGDWIPRDTGNAPIRRIVFTTRDERLSSAVLSVQEEINLMDETEAMDLFNASAAGVATVSSRSEASVKALVQRLANLPLAIVLASAYLREYPWVTVDHYLEEMSNFSNRSRIFSYRQAFSNYNHSIMSTWEISFTRVERDNPRAADLLTLLGFLVNGGVVLGWLKRVSVHAASSDLDFLEDTGSLEHLLGLLRSLALIYFDGATISLHPLVHEWIQARLQGEKLAIWGLKALSAIYCAYVLHAYPHSGLLNLSTLCLDHTHFSLKVVSQQGLPRSPLPEECYLLLLTILVYQGKKRERSSSRFSVQRLRTLNYALANFLDRNENNLRGKYRDSQGQSSLERLEDPSVDFWSTAAEPPRPSNLAFMDSLHQTMGQSAIHSSSALAVSFADISHDDGLIASMAGKMRRKLDAQITEFTELCTSLAIALVELREWWTTHSSNTSMTVPQPAEVTESLKKLGAVIDLCRIIPTRHEELDRYPPKILALLFIYVSSAAMNVGRTINMKLEKPTEEMRIWLFQKAHNICHHLTREARDSLLLDATVSYARFIDMRSLSGHSHWLTVEDCLSGSVAYAFRQGGRLAGVSVFFDFFCQSMWESDHEYALLRFCRLIQYSEPRISDKWLARLEARWKQIKVTEDNFTAFSDAEIRILTTFLDLECSETPEI